MFASIVLIIPSMSWPKIYYVDAKNGNDNNDGRSEKRAWLTIKKINRSNFQAGDSILFKRGEIWREQLIVPSSGTQDYPITFGAYGTGDRAKITSTQVISGSPTAFNVYIDFGKHKNADFESWSGRLLEGWEAVTGGASSVSKESNIVYQGKYSVKLFKDGSNKMILYRNMSYKQGMRYTIKFYVRGQSGGEEVGIMMRVFAGGSHQCQPDIDADGFHNIWSTKYLQSETYTLTNNWQEYVYKFQLPSNSSGALFKFEVNTQNATVYLDYIRAYPEWTPHPTIKNIYGIHWYGNVYGNEFLKDSTERLSVIGGDREENLLNHEISFSTSPYNIFWVRDDSGSPMKSGIQLEVSAVLYSIYTSGRNHLVFDDLEVYGAGSDYPNPSAAFLIKDSGNVTVSNCKVYLAKTHALSAVNSTDIKFSNNEIFFAGSWGINASSNSSNIIISNNSAHHCGNAKQDNSDGHGIGTNAANNILIELNDVYKNGSGGGGSDGNMRAAIMLYNTANSYIYRNRIHDNYRGGIDIAANGKKNISNNKVCYNLIYNNGLGSPAGNTYHFGIGLRMNQSVISENNKICNNVIYNNDFTNAGQVYQGAIKLTSGNNASITKTGIRNNILYNNISGYELSKFTWNGGIMDVDLDNNIYYRSIGGNIIFWEKAQDWNTYHNVNRNEPNSINKNPLFISESTPDFHLQVSSPAIDAGIGVGLTSDYAGDPIKSKPDIGAFEFTPLPSQQSQLK